VGVKKIVPTLWYLRGDFLALAVLKVYRYNEKVAVISGFHPNDETWATNSLQRKDIYDRTREEWGRLAGKDFTWFPYSEDAVARLYLRLTKRTADDLKAWEKELNAANSS
jgi:hypothetical protein